MAHVTRDTPSVGVGTVMCDVCRVLSVVSSCVRRQEGHGGPRLGHPSSTATPSTHRLTLLSLIHSARHLINATFLRHNYFFNQNPDPVGGASRERDSSLMNNTGGGDQLSVFSVMLSPALLMRAVPSSF